MNFDLEPQEVRERYDVKPMSRWWLVPPIGGILLALYVTGFDNVFSYGLVLFGMLLMAALVMAFPRHFLRRRDD